MESLESFLKLTQKEQEKRLEELQKEIDDERAAEEKKNKTNIIEP